MKCIMKKINKLIIYLICVMISFSQPLSIIAYAEEPTATEASEDEKNDDVNEEPEIAVGNDEENVAANTEAVDETSLEDKNDEKTVDDIEEDDDNNIEEDDSIIDEEDADTEDEEMEDVEADNEIEEKKTLNATISINPQEGSFVIDADNKIVYSSEGIKLTITGDICDSENNISWIAVKALVDGSEEYFWCQKKDDIFEYDIKNLNGNNSDFEVQILSVEVFNNEYIVNTSGDYLAYTIICTYKKDQNKYNVIQNKDYDDKVIIYEPYEDTSIIDVSEDKSEPKAEITKIGGVINLSAKGIDNDIKIYKFIKTTKNNYFNTTVEDEINVIIDKKAPEAQFDLLDDNSNIITGYEKQCRSDIYKGRVIIKDDYPANVLDALNVTIETTDGRTYSPAINMGECDIDNGKYVFYFDLSEDSYKFISVKCFDKAGNSTSIEKNDFVIDRTAPTVEITYNDITPQNGYYYNADRIAEITVTDKNFDTSDYTFKIDNKYGNAVSLGDWTQSGDSYKCEAVFKGDDEYSGSFSCVDKAGNKSDVVTIERFVVDKTAPKISYSYDNTSAHKSNYYNASRTAKISVDDISFTSKNVSLENNSDQSVSFSSWSGGGNNYTAVISCTADGKYQFYVTATDLAGNTSEKIDCGTFIIDTVAPSIEITGVMDKSANAGTVIPVINCNDLNLDNDDSVITLSGYKNGVVNPSAVNLTNGSKKDVTYDVFKVEKAYDDIYTVTAIAEDMAGNTTEISYMFSVNRFGSTFGVTKPTADLIDKYYTNAEQDLVLLETNVDNVDEQQLYITKNGKNVKLKKGVDYFIEKEGNDATWKAYTYTINKNNFQDEGTYEVSLFTTDRAGNKSDSNAKGMTIKFAVDKTAPSIAVAGVEENNVYKMEKLDLNIDVQDNMEIGYAEIEIDGTVVKKFEAEELEDVVTYSINESEKPMTVVVRAVDVVGNLTEKTYKNVTVSTLISDETVEMEDSDIPLGDSLDKQAVATGGELEVYVMADNSKLQEDNKFADIIFYGALISIICFACVGGVVITTRRKKK
ncbi:MAG: Ig-like domain-containing protein [Lachnospiraceae bacterium]|nr:Ig-like domain-containing protein [Lachnospiraceae bacterium]